MTTKLLIDRELLERVAKPVLFRSHEDAHADACAELRAILAAPRQPEGEAISLERVQAEADAFFDWPTADKSSVTTKSCLIFARCIAGMVAAERDAAVAELRERLDVMNQCADNYSRMFEESSEECERLRKELEQAYRQVNSECTDWAKEYERRKAVQAQRDRLAGLLAKAQEELDPHRHAVLWGEICAALAAAGVGDE